MATSKRDKGIAVSDKVNIFFKNTHGSSQTGRNQVKESITTLTQCSTQSQNQTIHSDEVTVRNYISY